MLLFKRHVFVLLSQLFALLGSYGSLSAEHAVTITALVHDSEARTLSGLSESDFRILDDNLQRHITWFRNLRPPSELVRKRPPEGLISNRPLAAFNFPQPVTILLIDTRNTDPEFQAWMFSRAARFVSLLRSGEDVAIYQLTDGGLKLRHQFSRVSLDTAGLGELETARGLDAESGNPLLREERYRSSCALIGELARYLARFGGRKNLLWISADFPALGGNRKKDERMPVYADAMLSELTGAGVAVYPVEVRTAIAQEPFERTPPGSFSNVPLRRRRVMNAELSAAMEKLAAISGGKSIHNRSQLGEAMFDAMEETRFAYELRFGVPEQDWNGKVHLLQVKVGIRDAQVQAQLAYTARSQSGLAATDIFDSPAIGISLAPETHEEGEAARNMKVFLATRDLEWKRGNDGWTANVEINVANTGKRATLTLAAIDHDQLATQTVSTQIAVEPSVFAKGFRLKVRDLESQQTGSITVPEYFVSR